MSTLPEVGWPSDVSQLVFIDFSSFELIVFSLLGLAEADEAAAALVLLVHGECGGAPEPWGTRGRDNMVRSERKR